MRTDTGSIIRSDQKAPFTMAHIVVHLDHHNLHAAGDIDLHDLP
jgi:hypothetical protein